MKRLILITIFLATPAFCEQIPMGQDAGATLKNYQDNQRQQTISKQLAQEAEVIPSLAAAELEALPSRESVYINEIILQQDPLAKERIEEEELKNAVAAYKGRSLSLEDIRALVSDLNQIYVSKNLKAYAPKQLFKKQVLYINLIPKTDKK